MVDHIHRAGGHHYPAVMIEGAIGGIATMITIGRGGVTVDTSTEIGTGGEKAAEKEDIVVMDLEREKKKELKTHHEVDGMKMGILVTELQSLNRNQKRAMTLKKRKESKSYASSWGS